MPQDLYKLPTGWEWSDLDSACSLITDGAHASPKTSVDGRPYITVRDVDDFGNIDLKGCKKISDADFHKLIDGNCSPKEGAVLFSKDGTVGKVALVKGYEPFVVLSSLAILQPEEKLLRPEYLRYFMLSHLLQGAAIGSKTGAAIKRIVLRTIKALQIPLPPLAEQERIVEKLDALFRRIDNASARLNQILTHTQALFASALDEMMQSKNDDWREATIGQVSTRLSTGPFGSMLHKADYVSRGRPLVNPINIIGDNIVPDDKKQVAEETVERLQRYILSAGDIVLARRGEIGRCAVVSENESGWICGTGSFFLTPDSTVSPYFLVKLVKSSTYQQKLESTAAGATIKNISNKTLANFSIYLPPLEEQQRIVAHLDGLAERIQKLEAATRARLDRLAALKASLLDAAFRGRL
ncbi:MAG: restriction endonuclease subunit S [Pontiellaceae bacterium]|nr:restriction endonuclease subunit S [Pontiellaceae bacterium]